MISFIVCNADPERLKRFTSNLEAQIGGCEHELVVVERPRSLAAGYNEGLQRATGAHLVFCHDDIEFLGVDLGTRMQRHFESYDGFGVAGTDLCIGPSWVSARHPHIFGQIGQPSPGGKFLLTAFGVHAKATTGIQALDGLFLAFRRDVIERVGWDEETFDGFHLYDVDTTYRAYLAGFNLAVVNDLPILHASTGSYGPEWMAQAERFMAKHIKTIGMPVSIRGSFSSVEVATREELLARMTPPWI